MSEPLRLPPGIYYDLPAETYHADPAAEPSLSAGFAQLLLENSPARAAHFHPRLNPMGAVRAGSDAMNEGAILHSLVLGADQKIAVIKADSFRSNDAKAARDRAIREGKIPILADKIGDLEDIAAGVRRQLLQHPEACEALSDEYASEVSLFWREETGAMCRARPDRFHRTDGSAPIYDFKFSDKPPAPHKIDRHAMDNYWDLRAAFYQRGAAALRDGECAPYRFIIVEKQYPYDLIVAELDAHFMKLGSMKCETAIFAFERCLAANAWPGWPRRLFHIEPPGWAEARWIERAGIEQYLPPDPAAAIAAE